MKKKFVKSTGNHERFQAGTAAMRKRGARDKCIMLVSGPFGSGKSAHVDNFGAFNQSVYIEAMGGMTLNWALDYLSHECSVNKNLKKFDRERLIREDLRNTGKVIIIDEAHNALADGGKVIDYLRRTAELAGTYLVMVFHDSELYRLKDDKLGYIVTRIEAHVEMKHADETETGNFLRGLCEVAVDDAIVRAAHEDSGGVYRMLVGCIKTLEMRADQLGLQGLKLEDLKVEGRRIALCEQIALAGRGKKK